jgi:hypothetical protein
LRHPRDSRNSVAKFVDKDAEVVGVVHWNRDEMDAAGIERLVQGPMPLS